MHFGLQEHIATISRHWGKILLVGCVAVLVTGAIAFLSSRVYISEARILILNSSPAERASRPSYIETGAGVASPQEQVLTQVEILKSPALAEKLALELGPRRVVEEMTWRWDWLRDKPGQWKDNAITTLYGWEMTAQVLTQAGIKKPTPEDKSKPPVRAARDKIIDAIIADGIVKTEMFGVAFKAPSADFSAEALNALIDIYVSHVVELRRPVDTAAIAQQEANRLEAVLSEAEEDLRAFSQKFDILSIERQKELLLSRWSRMQEELSKARGDAREIDSRLAVIDQQIATLPRSESISVTTRPNPVVDRMRERLVQLRTDLQRYVPGSAASLRIQREIATLSAQLEQEAQAVTGDQTVGKSSLYQQLTNTVAIEAAEKEAVDVRVQFLEKEVDAIEAEMKRVSEHELEYRQLARAVDVKEEAYRFALLKREETAIQTQIAQPSLAQVVPVERGDIPDRSSAPQRMRLLLLGVVAGGLAGVGLAYALEFSRRTMSTVGEAEVALGLPVLAVTERFGLLTKRLKRTRFEVRRFAVWVLHQRATDGAVRLLFSAAHAGTGQSTLVSELARALQQQGADVLTLRLEIADSDASTGDIQPVSGETGAHHNDLAVLRAPAWELERRVSALLKTLEEAPANAGKGKQAETQDTDKTAHDRPAPSYGVILIDAPDYAQFPEHGTLVEIARAVIPVVEAERTKLSDIRDLLDDLQVMDAAIPGVALTKRRFNTSSWAFSWKAMTQRSAFERTV